MPQEPAHNRAPVEIWDRILNLAIVSPLLPHPDDDTVDLYLLFTKECESQRIQRTVEGVRTRLRLVCRGWNASLRNKGVKMIIGRFEMGKPHRNEQYGKFNCQCGHSCLQPMDGLLTHPTTTDASTSMAEKFENLIVFMHNSDPLLFNGRETVAPRLQALRYECRYYTPTIGHNLQTQTVQGLSHLELTGLSLRAMVPVSGNVNLPRLFALSLQFTRRDIFSMLASPGPAPVPNTALVGWVLPSLRTLNMKGTIEHSLFPAVVGFLSRSWTTVTSLSVRLSLLEASGHEHFEIKPTFWDSFPNLHSVGISAGTLACNPSPPPVYNDLCLVIDFLWDLPHDGRARRILDDWKPCTIILLYSWEEILGMLRTEEGLHSTYSVIRPNNLRPSAIFAAAVARNIRLLDVHRVSIFHEDHKECLDLLQNWRAMSERLSSTG